MRIDVVALFCVLLTVSGCSAENKTRQATMPASPQENVAMTEDVSARVKKRLSFLPWITGEYSAGDASSVYVAFIDGEAPAATFERQNLGANGENRTAYYYSGGQLIAFEKWSRILSAAGAPSDGWYESETVIEFENGRFVRGHKSVNGAPSEPDEHEVRAAGRAGVELKARVTADLEVSATPQELVGEKQLIVRGMLDAGGDISLPAGAMARMKIWDVSKQDVAAETLVSEDVQLARLPAPFILKAPRERVAPNADLAFFAQILSGDRLLYITASRTPIDPDNPDGAVIARLTKVDAPMETAPGSGAGGMMITPPQDAYDCGGERLLIAIEAGGAFVTFADRSTLLLPLLPIEEAAPEKIFTNGSATLFVKDAGATRLRFARGRAAALECIRS